MRVGGSKEDGQLKQGWSCTISVDLRWLDQHLLLNQSLTITCE